MSVNLPNKDSATQRGLKTVAQSAIGFIVGLIAVVWTVPGVPEAVLSYVQTNLVQILLTVGIPSALASGATSFIWNTVFRKDVKAY